MAGIFHLHVVAVGEPWGTTVFTDLESLLVRVCESKFSPVKEAGVWWWTAELPKFMVDPTDAVVRLLHHNKTRLGDVMHTKTTGLGRQLLDTSTHFSANLTSDDIQLLAPELSKPVQQFLGK